jgi:hypothetical protein
MWTPPFHVAATERRTVPGIYPERSPCPALGSRSESHFVYAFVAPASMNASRSRLRTRTALKLSLLARRFPRLICLRTYLMLVWSSSAAWRSVNIGKSFSPWVGWILLPIFCGVFLMIACWLKGFGKDVMLFPGLGTDDGIVLTRPCSGAYAPQDGHRGL